MFDNVWVMEPLLAQLTEAAAAARGLAAACVVAADMRAGLLALQAHLDAVTVAQATLLEQATRARAWEGTGARDITDWLAGKTNTNRGAAKRKARLGAALGSSKKLADAVGNGELSPDAANEIADLFSDPPVNATDDDLDDLVDAVKGATPRDARDAAGTFNDLFGGASGEDDADRRYRMRSVTSTVPIDGMITTSVTLPTLEARGFLNAITHAAGPWLEGDTRSHAQRLADGVIALSDAYAKGTVTGGREKPTVVITMTLDTYLGHSDDDARTTHGDRIPAHVARQLAERAHLQRLVHAGTTIVHMGRLVRCATDDHFKALAARDGGCRYPGCSIPATWCDADHLVPWQHGGTTDPDNLVLWCRHHHTERHRPGVRIRGNALDLALEFPNGDVIECPPKGVMSASPGKRRPPPTTNAA
jgi:hypothetical protein